MILARFFTRRQVLINHGQMPEIGGKSVLVHASDNYQRRNLRDDLQPMREQDTGQREAFFFFFTKRLTLAIYKQRAYIFALEYKEQVGYTKMKKGLGFFL